jgi:PhzF family phenazine biosynthesis protein
MDPNLFQVDAFTNEPFRGNPAAVYLMDRPRADAWMQSLAAEMNLAETAFLLPQAGGWSLRWFTPRVEVDLCGHATLASAHVLFSRGIVPAGSEARFHTRSGELVCRRDGGRIAMDFPADPVKTIVAPQGLEQALGNGVRPVYTGKGKAYLLVEVDSPEKVRNLRPHLGRIAELPAFLVIVTAEGRGEPYDFVSRCFAPQAGIPEDPVTGSAHCTLACHWAKRLGKNTFLAHQASERGGDLHVELAGDRVHLAGEAVTVFEGTLKA